MKQCLRLRPITVIAWRYNKQKRRNVRKYSTLTWFDPHKTYNNRSSWVLNKINEVPLISNWAVCLKSRTLPMTKRTLNVIYKWNSNAAFHLLEIQFILVPEDVPDLSTTGGFSFGSAVGADTRPERFRTFIGVNADGTVRIRSGIVTRNTFVVLIRRRFYIDNGFFGSSRRDRPRLAFLQSGFRCWRRKSFSSWDESFRRRGWCRWWRWFEDAFSFRWFLRFQIIWKGRCKNEISTRLTTNEISLAIG